MDPLLGGRFDTMADDYDRSRPGYPDELVGRLDPRCDVVEVGCGSGQLTADLLRRGHRVVAVDPGPQLLALARRRCPEARFVLGRFEDADLEPAAFDLVAAGTSFHWVRPEVAYDKAASLLWPGGRLALLSHRVVASPISGELDAVIARCAPSFPLARGRTAKAEVQRALGADASDVSAVLAAIEGKVTRAVGAGGRFGPAEVSWVEWDQATAAPDLLRSLRATVAWPAVPASEQAALEAGVADLADRHGGRLPRRRVTFLVVATVRDDRRSTPLAR
jgi:SAM-dependent methyltransferase